MTKQFAPYFSRAAAGTIVRGLTTKRTRGVAHLQRQPIPSTPQTLAQRTINSFLSALAQAWTYYRPIIVAEWRTQTAFHNQDPYHNYIAANFARFRVGLWPTIHYPPDPASTPVNATHAPNWSAARAIEVATYVATYPDRAFSAWRLDLLPHPALEVPDAQFWLWERKYFSKRRTLKPLAPGTYEIRTRIVNLYGVAGTSFAQAGAIVTP